MAQGCGVGPKPSLPPILEAPLVPDGDPGAPATEAPSNDGSGGGQRSVKTRKHRSHTKSTRSGGSHGAAAAAAEYPCIDLDTSGTKIDEKVRGKTLSIRYNCRTLVILYILEQGSSGKKKKDQTTGNTLAAKGGTSKSRKRTGKYDIKGAGCGKCRQMGCYFCPR